MVGAEDRTPGRGFDPLTEAISDAVLVDALTVGPSLALAADGVELEGVVILSMWLAGVRSVANVSWREEQVPPPHRLRGWVVGITAVAIGGNGHPPAPLERKCSSQDERQDESVRSARVQRRHGLP